MALEEKELALTIITHVYFVNSAMTMADFILAVSERTVQN